MPLDELVESLCSLTSVDEGVARADELQYACIRMDEAGRGVDGTVSADSLAGVYPNPRGEGIGRGAVFLLAPGFLSAPAGTNSSKALTRRRGLVSSTEKACSPGCRSGSVQPKVPHLSKVVTLFCGVAAIPFDGVGSGGCTK